MSSGTSPQLGNLDLETDGASPWGDERSVNIQSPPITPPRDDGADAFKEDIAQAPESPTATTTTTTTQNVKGSETEQPQTAPTVRASTTRRNPRRPGRHVARVEAIDDDLGPLGPLGDKFATTADTPEALSSPSKHLHETPPEPPQKEDSPRVTRTGSGGAASRISLRGETMESVSLDDDEVEAYTGPPTTFDAMGSPERRRMIGGPGDRAPEQSQVAGPVFDISVGDPHKVGDLTSAHTVYQVRTKTTSKAYRNSEFTVSRRYRDFLWLYSALNNNNPGVVVPPPPEKQAVGRFDDNFVESRRSALERMLNKTAVHPILQHDPDLKLFLESEALNVDIKHKEKQAPPIGESKGMFSSLGFTGVGKFVETDEWFHDRKNYLDALETQLRSLLKAVDTVIKQRKDLAEAASDFSSSLHALSTVELSKSLSSPLEALSDLQIRIKELHERQAQQDVLTLGITVDEYIRLIGSIKLAFQQRQKAFHSYHAAESELSKRKSTFEKLQRQGKTQQDRLNQMSAEVGDSERKVHQARLLFDDMGRLMRTELDRFEREKVEDFKSAVETFLESAVEAQKELIELWETYLLQLDREEEEETGFRSIGEPTSA